MRKIAIRARRRIGKALRPATFVDEDAEADLPPLRD